MGLGSTIHQSSFKRFEFFFFFRFSWAAIPHGRIPSFFFFDSRFHSLLNLSFFSLFLFLFWLVVNGSLFFLLGLGPKIIYFLLLTLPILHAFVLSLVRYLHRIAFKVSIENLSLRITTYSDSINSLIIILLSLWGSCLFSLDMSL